MSPFQLKEILMLKRSNNTLYRLSSLPVIEFGPPRWITSGMSARIWTTFYPVSCKAARFVITRLLCVCFTLKNDFDKTKPQYDLRNRRVEEIERLPQESLLLAFSQFYNRLATVSDRSGGAI